MKGVAVICAQCFACLPPLFVVRFHPFCLSSANEERKREREREREREQARFHVHHIIAAAEVDEER